MKKIKSLVSAFLIAAFATMQLGAYAAITNETVLGNGSGAHINSATDGLTSIGGDRLNNAILNFDKHTMIDWSKLNVDFGQFLKFANGNSVILNKVTGGSLSKFAGTIEADTGRIVISNPNGIVFSGGQYISNGGLTLTTQNVDFTNINDGTWKIFKPAAGDVLPTGSIVIEADGGRKSNISTGDSLVLYTTNGADFIAFKDRGRIEINDSTITTPKLVMRADGELVITSAEIIAPETVARSKYEIDVTGSSFTGDLNAKVYESKRAVGAPDDTTVGDYFGEFSDIEDAINNPITQGLIAAELWAKGLALDGLNGVLTAQEARLSAVTAALNMPTGTILQRAARTALPT